MKNKNSKVYKIAPCPAYDLESMESWLADMAQKGLMLAKDGFFAGIAAFEHAEPQTVRYRFDAALKDTSMWADDGGEPDPEAVDSNQKYGWEYVAKCRNFYIYRTSTPDVRELNTDPQVQAIAINKVYKSQIVITLLIFFWLFILPIAKLYPSFLITMVNMKTWVFLLGTLIFIWLFIHSLIKTVHLGRLRKKLRNGEPLEHTKNWKSRKIPYHSQKAVGIGLIIVWICILLHSWNISILDKDTIALEDYNGNPPFATLEDFVPEDICSYTPMWNDLGFNTMREWSDWLAPINYEWNECAALKLSNGTTLECGLNVDYHETRSLWAARQLAAEYYQRDKRSKYFELIECPELNADYAVAYVNYFPTIVIQKGNKVIHASIHQTSTSNSISMEDWTTALVDSIYYE